MSALTINWQQFGNVKTIHVSGRTYHAVVEFAAFQKIPKRNVVKKKLSKVGTLESDPKYIEFLQKLEESKNFINNPSEYFHETESKSNNDLISDLFKLNK